MKRTAKATEESNEKNTIAAYNKTETCKENIQRTIHTTRNTEPYTYIIIGTHKQKSNNNNTTAGKQEKENKIRTARTSKNNITITLTRKNTINTKETYTTINKTKHKHTSHKTSRNNKEQQRNIKTHTHTSQ